MVTSPKRKRARHKLCQRKAHNVQDLLRVGEAGGGGGGGGVCIHTTTAYETVIGKVNLLSCLQQHSVLNFNFFCPQRQINCCTRL